MHPARTWPLDVVTNRGIGVLPWRLSLGSRRRGIFQSTGRCQYGDNGAVTGLGTADGGGLESGSLLDNMAQMSLAQQDHVVERLPALSNMPLCEGVGHG